MSRNYKSPDEVPSEVLAARLRELSAFITKPSKSDHERLPTEFYMRIPAEVDHDADIVFCEAARRLEKLSARPAPSAVGGTWISRKFMEPEDNMPVLWCRAPVCEPYVVACMCSDEFRDDFTHWMELPPPPEAMGGQTMKKEGNYIHDSLAEKMNE